MLHQTDDKTFPVTGTDGTDLYALYEEMFKQENNIFSERLECQRCNTIMHTDLFNSQLWHCTEDVWKNAYKSNGSMDNRTLNQWLKVIYFQKSRVRCK